MPTLLRPYVLNILPSVSRSLPKITATGKLYLLSWQTSKFFLNTPLFHWHLNMKVHVFSPPYALCCGTNWPVDQLSPHPRVLQPCYKYISTDIKFKNWSIIFYQNYSTVDYNEYRLERSGRLSLSVFCYELQNMLGK